MATYWGNSCLFGLRYVSWYKCLIVSLFFLTSCFWNGNLFLIAPFPDLCLLVPFCMHTFINYRIKQNCVFAITYLYTEASGVGTRTIYFLQLGVGTRSSRS